MSKQTKPPFNKNLITVYGRKAVQEALMDNSLTCFKLHLAESNKSSSLIDSCIQLAQKRHIEVVYHSKRELSFISKNAKQDQGIALDIRSEKLATLDDIHPEKFRHLVLLDNVTNPQNVGMIIRSCAAGFIDGLILPKKGCAELGPLVIKASAGTVFKAQIFRCDSTIQAINTLQDYEFVSLSLDATDDFYQAPYEKPCIFVLGNETEGVSKEVENQCERKVFIPMKNEVESLNVAVTASLIAFHPAFRP